MYVVSVKNLFVKVHFGAALEFKSMRKLTCCHHLTLFETAAFEICDLAGFVCCEVYQSRNVKENLAQQSAPSTEECIPVN